MIDDFSMPSYVNMRQQIIQNGQMVGLESETTRYLHFPYVYLSSALASAADTAFRYWDGKFLDP